MTLEAATRPAVTIGLMTRNYGRFLRQAVESVLAQTRSDWEMIICDDASTDDTAAIVGPFLSDPRIRYVRHEVNLGQAGNWAFALAQGTAPIVAVLHADDHYLPETFSSVLAAFDADPQTDMVYGSWWREDEGRESRTLWPGLTAHTLSGADEYRLQARRNLFLPSVVFLSRRVVEAAGPPNLDLGNVVDYEFFLRICAHARHVRALAQPLTVYRMHRQNASTEGDNMGRLLAEMEQLPSLCERHAEACPAVRSALSVLRQATAEGIFSSGVTRAVQGRLAEGRSVMWRAVQMDARVLRRPMAALDWLLIGAGSLAWPLFRSLHRTRL